MTRLCVYVFLFCFLFVNSLHAKDPIVRGLDKYPITITSLEKKDSFGGSLAKAGYRYGYNVSYAKLDGVPYAAYIGAEAAITGEVLTLGFDFLTLESNVAANALNDTNRKAEFVSEVKILGFIKPWNTPKISFDFGTKKEYWNSKDRWGKEKYRAYRATGFDIPIYNPFVPLSLAVRLGTTVGLTGSLFQYSTRYPDIKFEYGPYVNVNVILAGRTDLLLLRAAAYGNIQLVGLDVKAFSNIRMDISPETRAPSAYFKFSIPFTVESLAGNVGVSVDYMTITHAHWHRRWWGGYPHVRRGWKNFWNSNLMTFSAPLTETIDLYKQEKWFYRN